MKRRQSWLVCLSAGSLLTAFGLATPAAAQSRPPLADPRVLPASANRAATPPAAESVRFTRRASQAGDQSEQVIARETRLTISRREGDRIVESTTRTLRARQQRQITTIRVDDGNAQSVLLRYKEATKQIEPDLPSTTDNATAPAPPAETATASEPVAFKTYRCSRDGESLIVTDEQGRAPPSAELEIVSADLASLGRSNPLADFLAGRTIAIGEKLIIPNEAADRVLAVDSRLGKIEQFTLTLREIRTDGAARCAVFQATIEAASTSASPMRLIVDGPIVVEIDTCRTVASNLSGPLVMSESRGSYSAAYQLITTGKLATSTVSTYRDAHR